MRPIEVDQATADALTAENTALKATTTAQAAEIATLKANQKPANFAEREFDIRRREAVIEGITQQLAKKATRIRQKAEAEGKQISVTEAVAAACAELVPELAQ